MKIMNLQKMFACLGMVLLCLAFKDIQGMLHQDDLVCRLLSPSTIGDDECRELFCESYKLFEQGQYDDAVLKLKRIINYSLDIQWHDEARHLSAYCRCKQRLYGEALNYLNALKQLGECGKIKYVKAVIYYELQNREVARYFFREVIIELKKSKRPEDIQMVKTSKEILKNLVVESIDPLKLATTPAEFLSILSRRLQGDSDTLGATAYNDLGFIEDDMDKLGDLIRNNAEARNKLNELMEE